MTEPDLLAEAIARCWVDDPLSATPVANCLGPELLVALRQLESAPPAAAALVEAETLSLLRAFPEFERRVLDEFETLRDRNRPDIPGPAVDVSYQARHYRHSLVEVAYATDRRAADGLDRDEWYGGDRGELAFGVVQVSIPDDHRMGQLAKPRAWGLGFREDKRSHVKPVNLAIADPQVVDQHMTAVIERAPEPEILIIIHGYNVGFSDAATRAAQIAYDIDFKGTPFLFSWPSAGSALDYFTDSENAQWSQRDFRMFLRLVLNSFGATRVHALAHSMGNRLLTEALASGEFACRPAGSARLGQVVFAAPDVDSDVFVQRAQKFIGQADRYTLYVSENDRALAMSQRFAKYPRAGQGGSAILIMDGVDTIDVSDLDVGLIGHSYIGTHRSLISDFYYMVNQDCHPGSRFGLAPVTTSTGTYWVFRR